MSRRFPWRNSVALEGCVLQNAACREESLYLKVVLCFLQIAFKGLKPKGKFQLIVDRRRPQCGPLACFVDGICHEGA